MAATREDIDCYFNNGVRRSATHMIIVCDMYDHEDLPIYVMPHEDVYLLHKEYDADSNYTVMEVYNLSMNKEQQLREHRAFNF